MQPPGSARQAPPARRLSDRWNRARSGRGGLILAGLLSLVVLIAVFSALRPGERADGPARDILISAQNGSYEAPARPLELRLGEKVSLTVANHDAGVPHDFLISGLGVSTTGSVEPGASQTLVFVPRTPGVFTYTCRLHPGLMDGQVVVRQR
jgi:plastocyanin